MAYPFFGKWRLQSTPGYAAFILHHQDSAITRRGDLFGPSTAKSLVDSAGLLVRQGDQVNWPEFEARMTTARMGDPVRAYLGLRDSLGADAGVVPGHLKMRSESREFGRALGDYIALFPSDLSVLARARRDWLLCAELAVALGRNFQRLKVWPTIAWRRGSPSLWCARNETPNENGP